MEYRPTNRDKAREPRGGKFWCHACDGDFIGVGERCRRCGTRCGTIRAKKPTPFE